MLVGCSKAEAYIDDSIEGVDIFNYIPKMIEVKFKVPFLKKDFTLNIRKHEKV